MSAGHRHSGESRGLEALRPRLQIPLATRGPGQQQGNTQVALCSLCCHDKAAVGIGPAAHQRDTLLRHSDERSPSFCAFIRSLSVGVFTLLASGLQGGCCSSRPHIRIQGRKEASTKGIFFFNGRKQKHPQMPALQLIFIHVLLARAAVSEPQPQSRLGKQVLLSGVRHIAALHKSRILRRGGWVPWQRAENRVSSQAEF